MSGRITGDIPSIAVPNSPSPAPRNPKAKAARWHAPAVATALKRADPSSIVIGYQGAGDMAAIGPAERTSRTSFRSCGGPASRPSAAGHGSLHRIAVNRSFVIQRHARGT